MITAQERLRNAGPITKVEKGVGIENVPFRAYLRMHGVFGNSSKSLLELSDMMATSEHPVVQAAAGWATAETALYPADVKGATLGPRLDALDKAKKLWNYSLPAFQEAISIEKSPEKAARLMGFELRTRQAIAYLPSMQLAAYWFSGMETDEAKIRSIREQTKDGIRSVATDILTYPGEGEEFNRNRSGMSAENLVGALINNDPYSRYLILPGSIRQDNNFIPTSRADLIAIDTHLPHRRTQIQISGGEKTHDEVNARVIFNPIDLLMDRNDTSFTLLGKFVGKETGMPQSPTDLVWLDMLSLSLADQLDSYAISKGWQ